MTLEEHGATLAPGAITGELAALHRLAGGQPAERAGVRLHGLAALDHLAGTDSGLATLVSRFMGRDAFPVRALLFDKSAAQNWSLAWHQDRTVVVRERHDVAGFGPWTVKAGLLHVAPPPSVLATMITVRVHLDPVPATNAPLLIAPGSHRLGRVAEGEIDAVVARCGTVACLAEAGDVWLYATPILHASAAASLPTRRGVLQVDYAADPLPAGLAWRGIGSLDPVRDAPL